MIRRWDKKWKEGIGYRQSKLWFPTVYHEHRGQFNTGFHRRQLGKIVQFITGFNNMNHHQWVVTDKKVKDICRACDNDEFEETGWHLAFECDAVAVSARVHLNVFTLTGKDWSKEGLLAFINSPTVARLMNTRVVIPKEPQNSQRRNADDPDDPVGISSSQATIA